VNSQHQQQPSGFKCPVCGGFIPVSIQQLLTNETFFCPVCGLEIRLNRNDSQNALNALQKVHNAEENVKKASVFNGNRY
jgi:transcription elongation factor Elf1